MHKGAASLSDAEILAIFLRTGVKGKSALDMARQMLKETGGLRALLERLPGGALPLRAWGPLNTRNCRRDSR